MHIRKLCYVSTGVFKTGYKYSRFIKSKCNKKFQRQELTFSEILPGKMGVVLSEEGMVLDLVYIDPTQTALPGGKEIADQGNTAGLMSLGL